MSICSQSHYAEVYCTDDDSTGVDPTGAALIGDYSTGAELIAACKAQKLAPAEKNSTDISAAVCLSALHTVQT